MTTDTWNAATAPGPLVRALGKNWWLFLLRGVAAIAFGVLSLIWPGISLVTLILLYGAYAFVDGIFALGAAIFGKVSIGPRWWLVLVGLAGIAAGIATFVWPGLTALGGGGTAEHEYAGRRLILLGANFGLYRAWDGIRGIDYLLTRSEVDPEKLGCCGQSGGGTLTQFLAALDDRIKVAVVSEGNTENLAHDNVEPPGSADDAEQNIVPGLSRGIDRADLPLDGLDRALGLERGGALLVAPGAILRLDARGATVPGQGGFAELSDLCRDR